MNNDKQFKKYCHRMNVTPHPIVVNNIIYFICEKLRCFENRFIIRKTPLSSMIACCLKKSI